MKLIKRRFQNLQNLKEKTRTEIGEQKFETETEARTEVQNSETETEAQNIETETEERNPEMKMVGETEARQSQTETRTHETACSCQAIWVRKEGQRQNCPTLWWGSDVWKERGKEGTKPVGLEHN